MELTIKIRGEWTYFIFKDGSEIRKNGYKHFYRANKKDKWTKYSDDSYYSCEEAKRKGRSTSEESNIWWQTQGIIGHLEELMRIKKPEPEKYANIAKKQKIEELYQSLSYTYDEKRKEEIYKIIDKLEQES